MKRKTIFFTGKEELELREEPIPEPGPGELLIEATRTLVSVGTEMIVYTRNFAPGTHWSYWAKYPFRAGYSCAGRVIGLGEGVTGWSIGDRAATRLGHSSHGTLQAADAARIPDGVSDEDATWVGLGKITQIGVRQARHQLGDDVVVIGLGPLGQLVTQYARLSGAREVIAIDTAERRLEMAAAHGATRTLRMTAAEALKPVEELTANRRADVVYEITGHPAVFATALPLARKMGTVVLLGDTGNPQLQNLTVDLVTRGLTIVGAHDGLPSFRPHELARWSTTEICELFLTYLARRQIRVADLITHRYQPEQAKECYTMLGTERDKSMGVIFEWK